jgi:hypothetical protein
MDLVWKLSAVGTMLYIVVMLLKGKPIEAICGGIILFLALVAFFYLVLS